MGNIKYTSTIDVVREGEYKGQKINYKGIVLQEGGYGLDEIIVEMSPETVESYVVIDATPVFGIDMYHQERSNKLYCDVEYLIKIFWKDGKESLIYISRYIYLDFIVKMNAPKYEP